MKAGVLAVIALVAFAPSATAAPNGTADLGTGATVGNGSIKAKGGYTAVNPWQPAQATLFVFPMAGGLGHNKDHAKAPANNQWAEIEITDLAVGQYAVFVRIKFTNGGAHEYVISAVSTVNVTTAGGNRVTAPGTAGYGTGDPTAAAGTVSVGNNGTYSFTDNTYVNADGCALVVVPSAGGNPIDPVAGAVPANNKWGPITINNLAAGSYYVLGRVQMSQQNGANAKIVYAPTALVIVPAAGGG